MYASFVAAVKSLEREVLVVYYAARDARTPFISKLLSWLVSHHGVFQVVQ